MDYESIFQEILGHEMLQENIKSMLKDRTDNNSNGEKMTRQRQHDGQAEDVQTREQDEHSTGEVKDAGR